MSAIKNPALTNARMVTCVSTLAAMLEENALALQTAEAAGVAALKVTMDLQDEIEDLHCKLENREQTIRHLEDDLFVTKQRCEDLRRDLDVNHRNVDYTSQSRAKLLQECIRDPYAFSAAISYRTSAEALAERGNKISLIRHVREATRWGLKETKDFVECFYDHGAFYVAPPSPEPSVSSSSSAVAE